MSRKSQTPVLSVLPPVDHDVPRAIVAFARNRPGGLKVPPHTHPRAQLLYSARGTVTMFAEEGSWVAPPERAIWVPAGVRHSTRHSAGTELRSVFVRMDAVPGLPTHCAVVQVSPLLRELLLAVMDLPTLYDEDGADGRLVRVLLDRIATLPDEPLHLPIPASRNLRAIAAELAERPGVPLAKAAREAAMSPRSFARHFQAETGLSFGAWQRQARLLRALELLGAGLGVGDVAFTLGYESTSAFIAMFRRAFSTTPTRYFEASK
jgi:AraC-like DNA-binding protein/mannose-6-phosphate isomerase-like protein (cupin superfamily)